jgi:Uncharacterized protein conserved in bacteria
MKRLRELREERGLTLEQVANDLALKNQYVSNYELGKRRPDYETLKNFATYYNVSTDYLLEYSEYREKYQAIETAEFIRALLVEHGIISDNEDISKKQLHDLFKKVGVIFRTLK